MSLTSPKFQLVFATFACAFFLAQVRVNAQLLCPKGQYSTSQDGGAPCKYCPDGTYQDKEGQQFCKKCPAGTTTHHKNTVNSVLACNIPCPPGVDQCLRCPDNFFGANGFDPCYPCTDRVAGKDKNCPVCEPNQFRVGAVCTRCPTGYLKGSGEYCVKEGDDRCSVSNRNPADECTLCSPGQESRTGFRPCTKCQRGEYSSAFGAQFCWPCPREYQTTRAEGAVSEDYCINKRCEAGSTSESGREPCRACARGTFQSLALQKTCKACTTGFTTGNLGARFENECIKCPSGQSKCELCPRGHYSSNGLSPGCKKCAAGTFQTQYGQTKCESCPTGMVSLGEGALSCQSCPKGTEKGTGDFCVNCDSTLAAPKSSCVMCAPGSYSNTGYGQCSQCEKGWYQPSIGRNDCSKCPFNTTTVETGSREQDLCVSPSEAAIVSPSPGCAPGRFMNKKGKCKRCNSMCLAQ